jgi:hypothetical protein
MIAVLIVLLALIVLALAVTAGHRGFHAHVSREVAELFFESGPPVGPAELARRGDSLPAPILRYLSFAIPAGAPAIRTARLKHDGFFRTKPGQRWFAIRGEEYFTAGTPGFVWAAAIRPAPLVWIEARDRLLAGRGNMLVKFCSTFTIGDASGPEMDQGSGLRWLAEAIWFPYAFAGDRVQWEPVDDRSARVTLIDSGLPMTMLAEIDDEGKLVRISADRYRDVDGRTSVLTRWVGKCGDYQEFGGFKIPVSVDVAWDLDGREFTYARFRITALECNVPSRW